MRMLYRYFTDHSGFAPSQQGRTVYAPGKITVPNAQHRPSTYIHTGNAFVDSRRECFHRTIVVDSDNPGMIITGFSDPTVVRSVVETVEKPGIKGTHTIDETELNDVRVQDKSMSHLFKEEAWNARPDYPLPASIS